MPLSGKQRKYNSDFHKSELDLEGMRQQAAQLENISGDRRRRQFIVVCKTAVALAEHGFMRPADAAHLMRDAAEYWDIRLDDPIGSIIDLASSVDTRSHIQVASDRSDNWIALANLIRSA